MEKEIRLHKFISTNGITSRRKAEELISAGRVRVNGIVVTILGTTIKEGIDIVEVDGKVITEITELVYIMLNKPVGYITTVSDEFKRPKVIDLVGDVKQRVYPVGRLDYNSSGLLLLTNDGEFAHRITHPSYEIEKTYLAKIKGCLDDVTISRLEKGIKIDNYVTSNAQVRVVKIDRDTSVVQVKIHEGRNRQVRKMFSKVGHKVIELERIAIGNLELGKLKKGSWRYLTKQEEMDFKSQLGILNKSNLDL